MDDEHAICEYLANVLSGMGVAVYSAQSVAEALDVANSDLSLDVAFVDLALPDRTGLELIAELRLLRPQLPVVIATGYGRMAKADALTSATPHLVLAKPYDQIAIAHVLRTMDTRIEATRSQGTNLSSADSHS